MRFRVKGVHRVKEKLADGSVKYYLYRREGGRIDGANIGPDIVEKLVIDARPGRARLARSIDPNLICKNTGGWIPPSLIDKEPYKSYVYFLAVGGRIKIGISRDVYDRVATLQTAHTDQIIIRCVIPGGLALERFLHARFATHRIAREWFSPHAEIEEFVNGITENTVCVDAATD